MKVFKESKVTADGLDSNDSQIGSEILATEHNAGSRIFQIDFASPGLAINTDPVDLYLELVVQVDNPSTADIVDGAEMGQQAEVSLALSDIQASVDVVPDLDQSGSPIGHNWYDTINPSKEKPVQIFVALAEDQRISLDQTQLSVVTQLSTSTTKTFTLTNTTNLDQTFSIIAARPVRRTISLNKIIDDSTDDIGGKPFAINSVKAELNPADLELQIVTAGNFSMADLLELAPPGGPVALILLDTDKNNEGQIRPEDFGEFSVDNSAGVDYVLEIRSMGAGLVAELINHTDDQDQIAGKHIPVQVESQSIGLSVPRRSLSKTDQSPIHVWVRLGDDYTDKGTVSPILDVTIPPPTVENVDWVSVQPITGTLSANNTREITVTIETNVVGFSEAELLIQDSANHTVASVTVSRTISGIELVRLSVSPDHALMKVGQTLRFVASGEDLTGVEREVTTGLYWSLLGNAGVGTIDSAGLFTANQSGLIRVQVAIRDSNDKVKVRAVSDEIEVIDDIQGDSTGSNGQPDGMVNIFDLVNMANHWQETITSTTATSSEFIALDIAGGGSPQVVNFDSGLTGNFYDFSPNKPNVANLTAIEDHVLNQLQMEPDYTNSFGSIDFPNTSGSLKHRNGTDTEFRQYFLAHFTGLLKVSKPGTYQFHIGSDDGFRLEIEGQTAAVFNNPRPYKTTSASYVFDRPGEYTIDLSFFEWGGAAGVKLEWTMPGQGDGLIDIFDLVVLADNFGRGLSEPLSAPSISADFSTDHQANSRLRALSSDHTLQINDHIRSQAGQAFELQAVLEGMDQIQAYTFDLVYDSNTVEMLKDSNQLPIFTDGNLLQTPDRTTHSVIKHVQKDHLSAVKVSSVLLGHVSTESLGSINGQTRSLGQLKLRPKTVGQSMISIRNLILIGQDGQPYTVADANYMLQVHRQVDQTRLLQNYPNPFNPETWIPFELKTGSQVTITVYNQLGEEVRKLDVGYKVAGPHHNHQDAAYWDGRNNWGEPIASGVYFYRIQTDDHTETRKMVILK